MSWFRSGAPRSLLFTRGFPSLFAGGVIAAVALNCTLITAKTNGQCYNDGECRARGPEFANTRCSAAGTCDVITLPEAGSDGGGGPCQTNQECNVRLNTKARCATGECQALTNPSCTVVDGDPTDPNAIFIGVMTPRSGKNAAFGLNEYAVASTAAAEWQRGITGQGTARNFVTVGCDEIADPIATATFLAAQVQVSAIFGPVYDKNFEDVAPIASQHNVYLLGSRADDPALTSVTGIGKNVWSWSPNRSIQVKYFQAVLDALEPSVKASQGLNGDGGVDSGASEDMKVALAVGSDISSTNFASAIASTMKFNGKTAAANGANFVQVPITVDFATANDYTGAVTKLVQEAPDLVIVTQEYDLLAFVNAVSTGWTLSKFPRFLFMVEDTSVEQQIKAVVTQRFRGHLDFVTWNRNAQEQSNAVAFAVSYRTAAGADPPPNSESFYDAFYENAYAFQSVLDKNGNAPSAIDTTSYAAAILKFNSPGTPINVGLGSGSPSSISQMLTLLSAGGDADLEGASGPLEFDGTAASPIQDAILECVHDDGTVAPSGITLSGTTGASTGAYSCL